MDNSQTPIQPEEDSLESLEPQQTGSVAEPTGAATSSATESQTSTEGLAVTPGTKVLPKRSKQSLLGRFNIYLLLFIGVVIVAIIVIIIAYFINRKPPTPTVKTQSLSSDTLKQLAASDVTVGQPKQVLNVQSNAVFAGKVLINDSLEVAGPLQVGGTLSIPGITVSGQSKFEDVQISKSLAVAGDSAFQGQLSTQKNITVAGGGTFGGALSAPQLSVNSLQINGDLNLTHHISVGGPTPSRSNGSALGNGGSAGISGSDSAGSVNINTGSGAAAGCFVTINFTQKYNATPHVLITPVGAAAGGIGYYVNRTTSNFSICAADTPPSGASFGFDYFVLD